MTSSRKLRTELAAYLEPYGMSVAAGPQRTAKLFDGDVEFGTVKLTNLFDMVGATKSAHARNPAVPILRPARPPKATTSREPVEQPAPRPVAELEDTRRDDPTLPSLSGRPATEDGEGHDEGQAAFVEQLVETMPTQQDPPWDVLAAAAKVARERDAVRAEDPVVEVKTPAGFEVFKRPRPGGTRHHPHVLLGCQVITRVRSVHDLDDEGVLLAVAAQQGLDRGLPTWFVRDPDGRLAILVTNTEAA